MTDEPMDLVSWVHGQYEVDLEHLKANGYAWDIEGRTVMRWWPGIGASVEIWADERPALEQDLLMYGNVYFSRRSDGICDRIDPARVSPVET